MNIWIFNHYAVGPNASGFTRHYDFAKELIKRDVKVSIFAASFNYQTKQETVNYSDSWYKIEYIDDVRFVWIKTIPYSKNNYKRVINMLEYSFKVFLLKSKLDDKPTHIIGSLMHPFAAISGALIAKKKKLPFIFEERDLWPQSMIDLGGASEKSIKVKLLRSIEDWLIKSSDKIILLFDKAKDYMLEKGVPNEKLMVISNGIAMENFDSKKVIMLPKNINEIFDNLVGKQIAVYTGAHGMANNLDLVLDVAKDLKDYNKNIHFLFLGDGVYKKELIKRQVEENIDNVTFIDSINKEFIPQFLRNSDIGLLPLHNSPVFNWGISPNKMYDYMGAKLPVFIITDIESDALNKSNPSILINKNQHDILKKYLLEFSENPQKGKELGEKGYKYVNEECTWEYLTGEFLKSINN